MNTAPWTPADIQYLKDQRAAGASINKIALYLDRNRGAVAGKAKRLNISTPNPAYYRSTSKPPKHPPPHDFAPTPDYTSDSRNLPLLDLHSSQCHYPYGDGVPRFFFCGADASTYPYCEFHRKLVYRKW